jgi:GDP-4-dehydro-6-deoxy-D-mannose reductase
MPQYSRLLVTGAAGFVGRHLLTRLRSDLPDATLIAAIRPEDDDRLPGIDIADDTVPFDLLNPSGFEEMLCSSRPDGIVHLAAQPSVADSFVDPLQSWQANLVGTVGLAETVLRLAPHCRFVLASSAEIYGLSFKADRPVDENALLLPTNPYAASKAACDLAVAEMCLRGLNAVRIRAFNHTGSGQSEKFVVASLARQIARIELGQQEPVLHVGALDRWRDFLDVGDVCAAYSAALTAKTESGAVYNVASGVPRRIGDILSALLSQSRVSPRIETEALRLRPTDIERVVGNATSAFEGLGWRPIVPWATTLANVLHDWRGRVSSS